MGINKLDIDSVLSDNILTKAEMRDIILAKVNEIVDGINSITPNVLLQQVAWGVPLLQSSSPQLGVVGNLSAWQEYKRMSGRYLVTASGKAAKLSPTDSSVYSDGTVLDESKGNVMSISPRLYFLVQNDNSGTPYLWMSMLPISGHYIGDANNGEYNCIGAYKGSYSGSNLLSRSGVSPDSAARTIESYFAGAQANGEYWGLTNFDHRKLLMMFGLSEYGNTNIQDKLGYGIGGSQNMDLWSAAISLLCGATKSLGDSFGKIDISLVNGGNTGVNCSRVSLLGIEDPYGWQWEFLQGIYCGSSGNSAQNGKEIFLYKGNRMPTSTELTTHPAGLYRQLERVTAEGWVKKIISGEYFDIMPSEVGADSSSYWCDYSWANTTGQVVLWGGDANLGATCGLASAFSNNGWSIASAYIGSRLAYYGPLDFVDGKNI
jgi:hypothetical protein